MDCSLALYSSVLEGNPAWVTSLTKDAQDWTRSIQSQGGPWQGTFVLTGDLYELQDAFYNWMGYHLEERAGGLVTWEGMIYEMELVHKGVRRRRSLDLMANRIMTGYLDPNSEVQNSSWATNDKSIARYGQKDEILNMDNVPQHAAEAHRDRTLKEWCWPWPRAVATGKPGETFLEVTACGYIFTLNWRFTTQTTEYDSEVNARFPDLYFSNLGGDASFTDYDVSGQQDFSDWETTPGGGNVAVYSIWVMDDEGSLFWGYCGEAATDTGADDTIMVYQDQALTTAGWNGGSPTHPGYEPESYYIRGPCYDWISDIIDTDAEFLSTGQIATNLMNVSRTLTTNGRCWDVISDIVSLGDTDGDPWRFYVGADRLCYYEEIDTTPRYYLRDGVIYDGIGAAVKSSAWGVQPAVVRDTSYTVTGRQEYSGWLEDARDMYVEEVSVNAEGEVSLRTGLFDEADILGAGTSYLWGISAPED